MSRSQPRIPKEIDDLIWKLTEDGTPAAFDQFRARYPEHSKTLANRLQMVDRLKGSRPTVEKVQVPKFRPASSPVASRPFWSPVAIIMVSVAVFAVCMTVFVYLPRQASAPPRVRRDPDPVATGFVPKQSEETIPGGGNSSPGGVKPTDGSSGQKVERTNTNTNTNTQGTSPDKEPAFMTPQSLAIRNARLSMVLQAVAQQGKFEVSIGPGLADPVITVDYRGVNSIDILQDLGRQYAFTPFDQGDGTVIIVPARDPNAVTSDKSVNPSTSTTLSRG